jgi:hypothetical protein
MREPSPINFLPSTNVLGAAFLAGSFATCFSERSPVLVLPTIQLGCGAMLIAASMNEKDKILLTLLIAKLLDGFGIADKFKSRTDTVAGVFAHLCVAVAFGLGEYSGAAARERLEKEGYNPSFFAKWEKSLTSKKCVDTTDSKTPDLNGLREIKELLCKIQEDVAGIKGKLAFDGTKAGYHSIPPKPPEETGTDKKDPSIILKQAFAILVLYKALKKNGAENGCSVGKD